MCHEDELRAAVTAAEQAGRYLRQAYAAFTAIPDARADISTEADRQSQEIILRHLHQLYPADGLCAEEGTPTLTEASAGAKRTWVVDPIDGTRGFARKNGEFSVMVALVDDGEAVVGVVLEPAAWRVTYATRGGGCWRRDGQADQATLCRVTATNLLSRATLVQTHSRNAATPSHAAVALRPARVVETYSAGVKLARVARGEADVYVNWYPDFHDWDVCAGHVLVKEAGGTVTELGGEPIRYGSPGASQRAGLLATNGVLHAAALERLRDDRGS